MRIAEGNVKAEGNVFEQNDTGWEIWKSIRMIETIWNTRIRWK